MKTIKHIKIYLRHNNNNREQFILQESKAITTTYLGSKCRTIFSGTLKSSCEARWIRSIWGGN